MNDQPRVLRLLAAASVTVATLACGGADAAGNAAPSTPVAGTSFRGTAYLKTSNTVLYAGKTAGLSRNAGQALVDQCNSFRVSYGLPPVSPPDATMASLDVTVHEKYISTDKALTLITGTGIELTDMQRWMKRLNASVSGGALPAIPPDCAQTSIVVIRNATLWRDGLAYDLRYDTLKALGRKAPMVQTSYRGTTTFANLPSSQQLGQSCREVTGVADLGPDSHACIWDLFPYVSYLNWPYALSGRIQFGPVPGLFETIVPIAAERGQAIAASVFEIPAGFTVTLR